MMKAHMFEHADRNNAVESFFNLAVPGRARAGQARQHP
jgi:hypothetical protein